MISEKFHRGGSLNSSPINLAVFRIIFFLTVLGMGLYYDVVWFAGLPRVLFHSETLLKGVLPLVPINPETMRIVYPVFVMACVTGALGFFTRTSALIVTICGTYVLGVPQLFGKINHIQHLIWFAALLAVAPSGDALSADAVFKAFKRADRGITEPPGESKIYGLALFIVMLLMGVLYFFPGFWKLRHSGADWFLSDNLKWFLYRKWTELPDWEPLFRIDLYPFLYRPAAFGTILFELSFIVIILFPILRPWLGIAGLLFHNGTNAFMAIPFYDLQTLYVVFFNWAGIFKKIGRRLFPETLFLLYDGNCKLCRRTIAAMRVFDVFGRVEYVNALETKALVAHRLEWLSPEALLKDMHAVYGRKIWKGYEAYRALFRRIPVLWPSLPFLYFFPVAWLGERVYRHVADSRTCEIPAKSSGGGYKNTEVEKRSPLTAAALIFVGGLLILANTIQGIRDVHSWPFSVYPTFSVKVGREREGILMEIEGPSGEKLAINHGRFIRKLSASRWTALREKALKYRAPEKREKLEAYLNALWDLMVSLDPGLGAAVKVRFYAANFTGDPERRHENPIHPELLYEIDSKQRK
jgi:predicted DCC family thiol-disulfide oxidoreductase YuxK